MMQMQHKGTVRTDTIAYDWKFEDSVDHEHPYILTVTVAEHTHSEGYDHHIPETEALVKADHLARKIQSTSHARP
jgi:dsRNA-specific ribonuclease